MIPLLVPIGLGLIGGYLSEQPKKYHLGGEMSLHLAPNGKPSNLTHEQWHLVRTPEFKAWFGDWENDPENASKVVDDNGEPKVMWHYSSNQFFVFNQNAESRWINQRKENVVWFGGSNKVISYSEGEKGFLYQCFLNVIKPIEVNAQDYDVTDYYKDEKGNKTYSIQRIKGRFITKLSEVHWSGKKNDYDGVIFENAWDNVPLGLVVAVINPNQIKLADGSNTTFDSENPDIRYKDGGSVKTDFNDYDNNGFRKAVLSLWNDFVSESISNYLNIEDENYVLSDADSVMVIFRNKRFGNFTQVEIQYINNWIDKYFDFKKKPLIAKHLDGYDIDGNKIYIRFKAKQMFGKGGSINKKRTIAQMPAPAKERIYGSNVNKPKSAASKSKARSIKLDSKTISSIKSIIEQHNNEFPAKKIPLATAKAVVRRGMGAYSSSHRPTISGGKPNSRVAWGLARLNAFIYKIQKGKSKSGKYIQDDDLISELGYQVKGK